MDPFTMALTSFDKITNLQVNNLNFSDETGYNFIFFFVTLVFYRRKL
jgi:hypothetical protein